MNISPEAAQKANSAQKRYRRIGGEGIIRRPPEEPRPSGSGLRGRTMVESRTNRNIDSGEHHRRTGERAMATANALQLDFIEDGIARITFDQPGSRANTLNQNVLAEFENI